MGIIGITSKDLVAGYQSTLCGRNQYFVPKFRWGLGFPSFDNVGMIFKDGDNLL